MIIVPSILTGSLEEAQRQLDLLAQLPGCERVQIDVIDGWYADHLTITPADLVELDFHNLAVDLHLMTQEPLDFVYEAQAALAKTDLNTVIAQVERMSNLEDFVDWVKRCGWQVGLSLDLHTPASAIPDDLLPDLDIVQIMSVQAGEQGQKFNQNCLTILSDIQAKIKTIDYPPVMSLDGGITPEIAQRLARQQVNLAVVGSGLWQSSDPAQAWQSYELATDEVSTDESK